MVNSFYINPIEIDYFFHSTAGRFLTKLRTRMSDQTVDNLVFGHSYLKNLGFYVTFLTLPLRDILLIFITFTVPLQILNVGNWQDQEGGTGDCSFASPQLRLCPEACIA